MTTPNTAPTTPVRYDADADLSIVKGRRIAVLGYGSQGHAHALNLQDSGCDVRVGLRPGSASRAKAEAAGLTVDGCAEVAAWADLIMVLAPDTKQPQLFADAIESNLSPGDMLMFAHGFNIRYGSITAPGGVDIALVAPKSPGHRVRETFQEGAGVPGLVAVHQDATGNADAIALSYASAIGCGRAGILTTTFAEETETDLFGEQAILCGGVSSLVKAGFETLTEAGYNPEVAYFECLHELKLIVDLMYRGGLAFMRHSISDTAEYGDYVSGDRLINADVKARMKELLDEIQDGTFAKQWMDENAAGRPKFEARRVTESTHSIEVVGAKLRKMMAFTTTE